jgi:hypothetical protein
MGSKTKRALLGRALFIGPKARTAGSPTIATAVAAAAATATAAAAATTEAAATAEAG